MSNYDLCDESCYCNRRSVPLSCIECPIRSFKISCLLNSGAVNYNFETSARKIKKMRLMLRKKKKLLAEFCDKTSCTPEFLKQLLSKRFPQKVSADQRIPFVQIQNNCPYVYNTLSEEQETQEDEDDVFTRNLLIQLFSDEVEDTQNKPIQKKPFDEPNQNWINDLYELYASVAGPDINEELQKQRNQTAEMSKQMTYQQLQYEYNNKENLPNMIDNDHDIMTYQQLQYEYNNMQKENLPDMIDNDQESFYAKNARMSDSKVALSKMKSKKKSEHKLASQKLPRELVLNRSSHKNVTANSGYFGLHDRQRLKKLSPAKTQQLLPRLTGNLIKQHRDSDKQRAFMHMNVEKISFKREYENRPAEDFNLGYGDGAKK